MIGTALLVGFHQLRQLILDSLIESPKKQILPNSHKAVLEGRMTLAEAKELGRERSPFGPAKKTVSKADRSRLCMCGCERETWPSA